MLVNLTLPEKSKAITALFSGTGDSYWVPRGNFPLATVKGQSGEVSHAAWGAVWSEHPWRPTGERPCILPGHREETGGAGWSLGPSEGLREKRVKPYRPWCLWEPQTLICRRGGESVGWGHCEGYSPNPEDPAERVGIQGWSRWKLWHERQLLCCFRRLLDSSADCCHGSVAQSCATLWPHGLQHARPPCPSPTPGACSNSCP